MNACTRMGAHFALKACFGLKYSYKKSNADSKLVPETLLYGKRPSPVSQAGTVLGGKVDQDGYVLPSHSFLADIA